MAFTCTVVLLFSFSILSRTLFLASISPGSKKAGCEECRAENERSGGLSRVSYIFSRDYSRLSLSLSRCARHLLRAQSACGRCSNLILSQSPREKIVDSVNRFANFERLIEPPSHLSPEFLCRRKKRSRALLCERVNDIFCFLFRYVCWVNSRESERRRCAYSFDSFLERGSRERSRVFSTCRGSQSGDVAH